METTERRSAMFFESDVNRAAEDAAYQMEDHGLTPEQVEGLAQEIGDLIRAFVRTLRDAEDVEARQVSQEAPTAHASTAEPRTLAGHPESSHDGGHYCFGSDCPCHDVKVQTDERN